MSKTILKSAALFLFVSALGACTGSPLGNDEDFDCSDPMSEDYDAEQCEPIIITGTSS